MPPHARATLRIVTTMDQDPPPGPTKGKDSAAAGCSVWRERPVSPSQLWVRARRNHAAAGPSLLRRQTRTTTQSRAPTRSPTRRPRQWRHRLRRSTLSQLALCRMSWGAAPPIGDGTPYGLSSMTIHHTAVALGDNANAPARLRQHQQYHQSSQGGLTSPTTTASTATETSTC